MEASILLSWNQASASNIHVIFHHEVRSANGLAEALAKQGLLGLVDIYL